MQDPLLPRNSRKDPLALRRRMEQAAESVHREESKLWATLSLALTLGLVSGCSPAPTPAYGTVAPVTQTMTPQAQPTTPAHQR